LHHFEALSNIKQFEYVKDLRKFSYLASKQLDRRLKPQDRENLTVLKEKITNNQNDGFASTVAEGLNLDNTHTKDELLEDFLKCRRRAMFDLFVPENVS